MAKIHMILQGKGGVGKSFICAAAAQYQIHQSNNPKCIDTDPVNATFYGFKSLKVVRINLMDGDEINPRNFDKLIEEIADSQDDVIVDNGASSFVPLSHYLLSNKVPELLNDLGHELVVHTVITGGQAFLDTINGFNQLIRQLPSSVKFVVWLNPYWGKIEHKGKAFEEMKAYKENKERISALIYIPELKEETFGHDLSEMLKQKITFDEAIESPDRNIMSKQRLKIVRDKLYNQLDNAEVI